MTIHRGTILAGKIHYALTWDHRSRVFSTKRYDIKRHHNLYGNTVDHCWLLYMRIPILQLEKCLVHPLGITDLNVTIGDCDRTHLVGGNWLPSIFYFPINIGFRLSSQLTFIFFRGVNQPPTSHSSHDKLRNMWLSQNLQKLFIVGVAFEKQTTTLEILGCLGR